MDWQALLGDLTAVQLILWLAAVIALIVGITKAWPVVRRFVNTIDALSDLPEWKERLETKLDGVFHETHHNDGSSLKDSSARTEEAVAKVAAKLDDHIALCIGLEEARKKEQP